MNYLNTSKLLIYPANCFLWGSALLVLFPALICLFWVGTSPSIGFLGSLGWLPSGFLPKESLTVNTKFNLNCLLPWAESSLVSELFGAFFSQPYFEDGVKIYVKEYYIHFRIWLMLWRYKSFILLPINCFSLLKKKLC